MINIQLIEGIFSLENQITSLTYQRYIYAGNMFKFEDTITFSKAYIREGLKKRL